MLIAYSQNWLQEYLKIQINRYVIKISEILTEYICNIKSKFDQTIINLSNFDNKTLVCEWTES